MKTKPNQDRPSEKCLGLDIAKKTFEAALAHTQTGGSFRNDAAGSRQAAQLATEPGDRSSAGEVGMEATGAYWLELAVALAGRVGKLHVLNPKRIHAFGQSELSRSASDPSDAALIARFLACGPTLRCSIPPVSSPPRLA